MSDAVVSGIIKAGTLQQWVDTLTPLVDEARVHFDNDGLTTTVVDPANVASYLPVALSADAFESYDAPGSVRIGVPLTTLDERLGPANSDDLVELRVDMETRKLHLQYRTVSQSVGLIDPDAIRDEPDAPDLDLANTVTITGAQFAEAVEVSNLVSDHLRLDGDPEAESVTVVAEGDIDDSTVTWGRDDVLDAAVDTEASSLFSLEYLDEFATPMPADAEVQLWFGDEFPMRFEYTAAEGTIDVTGLLAPRIQSS